jgi:cob(I)alamin adenosyltransferase
MKLYTRRGDDGQTDLYRGGRVAKDDLRMQACGAVDELNSFVGLALCACRHAEVAAILRETQNRLFDLGAELATPLPVEPPPPPGVAGKAQPVPRVSAQQVRRIEEQIDSVCAPLPALREFVLPGGSELAARLHVARGVCRRAERVCVALAREAGPALNAHAVIYLNRLSDLLFALARRANQLEGVADVPWQKGS